MPYKDWENENIMDKEKFVEELESKISEAIETALEYAKKIKDGNDKTNILNVEYLMGQYHAYELLLETIDWNKFVKLHERYRRYSNAWLECQNAIEKLYH